MTKIKRILFLGVLGVLGVASAIGYRAYTGATADREQAELRAEVCGRLVDLGAMTRSNYSDCLRNRDVFNQGLSSAVRTRLPAYVETLNSRVAAIGAAGRMIDYGMFTEIDYATFEQTYDPFYFDDPQYNPNRDLDLKHLEIISAYRHLSFESEEVPGIWISPPDNEPWSGREIKIDIDPALADLINNTMNFYCWDIHAIDQGCHGTAYLVAIDSDPNGFGNIEPRIVAFDMAPLTDNQVHAIVMHIYAPDFKGGTRDDAERDARLMRLFLADFGAP